MWSLRPFTAASLAAFQQSQATLDYSYPEVGATTSGTFPAGYDHDRNFAVLGSGPEAYAAAIRAVQAWVMFPRPWAQIFPGTFPTLNETVVLQFHLLHLYWRSAARVIYLVDEKDLPDGTRARYAFAYGTLPGHVERGEERFTVAWLEDNSVVYELQAFSQPRFWMARLAKPLARCWQRRFVLDSQAAMKAYVQHELA
jgi:uncharacterized protein (UPF0548 family)